MIGHPVYLMCVFCFVTYRPTFMWLWRDRFSEAVFTFAIAYTVY